MPKLFHFLFQCADFLQAIFYACINCMTHARNKKKYSVLQNCVSYIITSTCTQPKHFWGVFLLLFLGGEGGGGLVLLCLLFFKLIIVLTGSNQLRLQL